MTLYFLNSPCLTSLLYIRNFVLMSNPFLNALDSLSLTHSFTHALLPFSVSFNNVTVTPQYIIHTFMPHLPLSIYLHEASQTLSKQLPMTSVSFHSTQLIPPLQYGSIPSTTRRIQSYIPSKCLITCFR